MKRRDFLAQVGRLGGSAALYGAMGALGLVRPEPAAAFSLTPTEKSKGTRVLILGAGLAGMCTAYEMGKLGYKCRILEARERPGGRCFSIRRGVRLTDTDGETQVCDFDDGLYLNCGPARIPGHHVTMDYCRELGVAIEPMVNQNESAFYHTSTGPMAGRRIRAREANADYDSHVSELLAKAISAKALDAQLTSEDAQKLLGYLDGMGGVDKPGSGIPPPYRRGFRVPRSAGLNPGKQDPRAPLHDMLLSEFGYRFFYNDIDQQSQMFQIVGGTDNLAKAFAARVGRTITYEAVVKEIRQDESGARVVYAHGGSDRVETADYVVCAIPLGVLADIATGFAPEVQAAIKSVHYHGTGKIGLQFKRRFWEEDDRIFGGISWTDQDITQIMYPSTGFLGKKGVVVGYYTWEPQGPRLGAMKHAQRLEAALAQGERIHPQYRSEYENSFSIYWPKVPYTLGGWAEWGEGPRPETYRLLNQPQGRVYLAGEHLSYLTGWMAGALESARLTSGAIHERASREAPAKAGTR